MHSQIFHFLNKVLVKFASTLGFVPLIYDSKAKQYKFCDKTFGKSVIWYLWVSTYLMIVIPTHIWETRQSKDFQQFNYIVIFWLCSTMEFVFSTGALWKCTEIIQFLNGYYKFLKDFHSKQIKLLGDSTILTIAIFFVQGTSCLPMTGGDRNRTSYII